MKILLGPLLYAAESTAGEWRFRVNLLLDGVAPHENVPLMVESEDQDVEISGPTLAWDFSEVRPDCTLWSWAFKAGRSAEERRIKYRIRESSEGGRTLKEVDSVAVPARGELPRFAFVSCNGVTEEKQFHQVADFTAMWSRLLESHRQVLTHGRDEDQRSGFHVLIGGGDQIYADSLWSKEPLFSIGRMKVEDRCAPLNGSKLKRLQLELRKQYLELYIKRWGSGLVADVLARIPGVFTWDDHDIFDGWGSHDERLQSSPRYQAIFSAAAESFDAFQVGGMTQGGNLKPNDPGRETRAHRMQSVRFHGSDRELEVLLLDLRSEREKHQVLSKAQWSDLSDWLATHAAGKEQPNRHLVVVSSIPLVYMRFRAERINAPFGLEDDRVDQWEHGNHRGERARLIMRLLQHAAEANAQITILSGDVHVGSRGQVRSTLPEHRLPGSSSTVIHQVTSSGIGHPPPTWLQWKAMELVSSEKRDRIADRVVAEILPVTASHRYLRTRNFLSGTFDSVSSGGRSVRLWLQWNTEEWGPISEQVVVET